MKDENVSNAILVLRGDITPFAKQAVLEMSDSFRIEHFKEAELLVDITEHTLVRYLYPLCNIYDVTLSCTMWLPIL